MALKWCGRLSLYRPAKEIHLVQKWLYRYKNAQRRDKAYQKLQRVKRDFNKYFNQDVHFHAYDTVKQALDDDYPEDYPHSHSTRPDSHAMLNPLLIKLSDCIDYIGRFLKFIESTGRDLLERIQIGHHIPLYIVVTASLSRIWFYMRLHFWSLLEAFRCISKLHPLLRPNHALLSGVCDKYTEFIPSHLRNDMTSECKEQLGIVQLSKEQTADRLRDFENPFVPSGVQAVNTKSSCPFKRVPNVSRIVLFDRGGKRRTLRVASERLCRRILRWRRTMAGTTGECHVRIVYLQALWRRHPLKHRVKRIRIELLHRKRSPIDTEFDLERIQKTLINKSHDKLQSSHDKVQLSHYKLHSSHDNIQSSHDRGLGNTTNVSIDDIFSTIDAS